MWFKLIFIPLLVSSANGVHSSSPTFQGWYNAQYARDNFKPKVCQHYLKVAASISEEFFFNEKIDLTA